ncbi:hypothetical protein BJ165DRAFT_1607253 [Panaeolus papilionaceus]|nr:hypothetical protein BJ165DRAFT_1607253 [Panaeolus papilionaceus]
MLLLATELLPNPAFHLGCSQFSQVSAAKEIKALALGTSRRDPTTFKRLCIDYHSLFQTSDDSVQDLTDSQRDVLQHLPLGIRSFPELETVSVFINWTQSPVLMQSILDGFNNMASLRHVTFTWAPSAKVWGFTFTSLSNLESFTFRSVVRVSDGVLTGLSRLLTRCPDLTYLDLDLKEPMDVVFQEIVSSSRPYFCRLVNLKLKLQHIRAQIIENLMPNLQLLKSITLLEPRSTLAPSVTEGIWEPFLRRSVFVAELKTDIIDFSLIPYISAIAARPLKLSVSWHAERLNYRRNHTFRRAFYRFLQHPLLETRHLLVELNLAHNVSRSWRWKLQYDTNVLGALSSLKRLKKLHIRHSRLSDEPNDPDLLCDDCMQTMVGKFIEFCDNSYPELEMLHLYLQNSRPHSPHDYPAPHVVHAHNLIPEDNTFDLAENAILNFPVAQTWDRRYFDITLCGGLYEVWRDPETRISAYVKSRSVRPLLHS